MEVSDLQSAQMMVDCQRVQPSSKNSTGGLTSQSDSSKGGKKKQILVCLYSMANFHVQVYLNSNSV